MEEKDFAGLFGNTTQTHVLSGQSYQLVHHCKENGPSNITTGLSMLLDNDQATISYCCYMNFIFLTNIIIKRTSSILGPDIIRIKLLPSKKTILIGCLVRSWTIIKQYNHDNTIPWYQKRNPLHCCSISKLSQNCSETWNSTVRTCNLVLYRSATSYFSYFGILSVLNASINGLASSFWESYVPPFFSGWKQSWPSPM